MSATGPMHGSGLVVTPFRGLRYAAHRVSDLAAVTSPPYDVIDPDDAARLEDLDPHNVVRLILPRGRSARPAAEQATTQDVPDSPVEAPAGYAEAARLLDSWRADGILDLDPDPALYVYEQTGPGFLQRGVIAAVGLTDPDDGVVLPHEDVMAGPVADRLALMRATGANLEPILLVYDGGGDAATVIEEVTRTEPVLSTATPDGGHQRLWAVVDPELQQRIATDLAPRQALIADGHHRWATYRRLQAERHASGAGRGPWDHGLALLVDSRRHPLRVAAIHRVVAGMGLAEAALLAAAVFEVSPAGHDLASALTTLITAGSRHPYVVTDGNEFLLLADPEVAAVTAAVAPERSLQWRSLDASVLHAVLLEGLWGLADPSPRVSYLHDADSAVRSARRLEGVAVLMRPVTVENVMSLAAAGETMPRKSTSFGPKPRTGLIMRLLDP